MNIENHLTETETISKSILYDIEKGNLKWEDEKVQYFLPIALYFSDWAWLELAAENILIEEDCKIVKEFLAKLQSMAEHNTESLNTAVETKIKRIMEDL